VRLHTKHYVDGNVKKQGQDKNDSPFGANFSEKLSKSVRDIVKDELVQQSRVGGTNYQSKK
jgi:hypothetical protein